MRITLYLSDSIQQFSLPTIISGSFSFSLDRLDDVSLVNIEARDNAWYLYTTDDVNVIEKNNIVDGVFLKKDNFYTIQKDKEQYIIYTTDLFDSTYNVYQYNKNINLIIGNDDTTNVFYNIPYLNEKIAYIKNVSNNLVLMRTMDLPIYVNNQAVKDANQILTFGDEIEIYGLKIYVLAKYILINNPAKKVSLNYLKAGLKGQKFEDEDIENIKVSERDLYQTNDYFSKAPRVKRSIEPKVVKLDNPPKREEDKDMPFILVIGPMLTMGMISFIMIVNTINKLVLKKTTFAQSWNTLLIGVVMMISILVWPSLIKVYNKKQKNKKDLKIIVKYDQYLQSKKNELEAIYNNQYEIINEQLIDLKECLNIIYNKKVNFWDKRSDQNDFLTVRIGIGDCPLQVDIQFSEQEFSVDENVLKERAQQLVNSYSYIKSVPLSYSFYDNKITAIMGQKVRSQKFMDNCILQLITFHSYDELKIAVFTNNDNCKNWDYIKYLNHNFNDNKNVRFFSTNSESSKKLGEFFNYELSQRIQGISEENQVSYKPYYLIIIDGYENAKNFEFVKIISELEVNLGFSIVLLENKMNNLPSKCNNFILLNEKISGVLKNSYEKQEQINFHNEIIYNINMMEVAKMVANIPIKINNEEYQLPDAISFLEMEKVGKVEQLNILNRWNENDPTLSLKAEVGVDSNGELIYLDLHEKAHGPHGLIAGMTGSGKSEFIITYILAMCINYSPLDVSFILIDYKGGGLAYAFENKTTGVSLPHLAGIITNLDKAELNRTLVSIDSEIKRRQKIFNEVRDKFEENTMDIYKYQRLYKDGKINVAVSHLFIICDEFAELKSQQPEFMDDLISVARIGRSLGVHLILATQKPAGVVNDQIWSNSKFRVCLKVQNNSDSKEMLKRPDAASLKQTGRFYLQVGYDELFELGQSAWTGAKYTPVDKMIKQVDHSVNFIDDCGTFIKNVKDGTTGAKDTKYEQISVILKFITDFAKSEHKYAKKLWLEKLPANILISNLINKYQINFNSDNIKSIVGEYDAPEVQEQGLLELDFKTDGNTLIFGNNNSEVEMLLRSVIYSISISYSADDINTYIIDYGSESFGVFEKFNSNGGVVYASEQDKFTNLLRLVRHETDKRKKLFSAYEGNYYKYKAATNKSMPIQIIILNNMDLIVESHKNIIERLISMTRDSYRYGVYYILTASSRTTIGRKLTQNFNNTYVLHISDPSDYILLLGSTTKLTPGNNLGRGLAKVNGIIHEFQTASLINSDEDLSEFITKEAQKANKNYSIKAPKIPVLPDIIDFDEIKNAIANITNVPIGMSKQTLKIVDYDFLKNNYTNIMATKLEKMNDFINSLLQVFQKINNLNIIVIDHDKLLIPLEKNYYSENMDTVLQNIVDFVEKNNRLQTNIVIVFYGITKLKLLLKSMDVVSKILVSLKKYNNISAIVCDSEKNLKMVEFENWYSNIKTNRDGIWIGNGFLEQSILRYIKPNFTLMDVSNNNWGYCVKDSEVESLKLIDLINTDIGDNEDEE